MMRFLQAHGFDAGPLQRPLAAGVLTGLLATVPAAAVFAPLGSFQVAADDVMRLPRPVTAVLLLAAFALSGAAYGLVFRRAANDRRGGWLFGAAFGFILWTAAPIVILPLIGGHTMASGRAATGFLAGFLVWGLATGALFPLVHRPLQGKLDDSPRTARRLGPLAAGVGRRLLRRGPRGAP